MPKGKNPSLQDVLDAVRANQEQLRGQRVILLELRSQKRATMEAIEMSRVTVEQRIDRFDTKPGTGSRCWRRRFGRTARTSAKRRGHSCPERTSGCVPLA